MAQSSRGILRLLGGGVRSPLPSAFSLPSRFFSSGEPPSARTPNLAPLLRNFGPPSQRRKASPSFTGTVQDLVHKSRLYNLSVHRSLYPMRSTPRRKIKRIHLPTHYVEVSYKLRKAVVFYQPSIAHIPHGIKDRNPLLVTSGTRRGQNT